MRPNSATNIDRGVTVGMIETGHADTDERTFRRLVSEALAHLYEPGYLLAHPLTQLLIDAALITSTEQFAPYLRTAVDALRPSTPVPHGSAGWRQYRYLYLRYIEEQGHRQIAADLVLSTRQATREHENGLQALSRLLWYRYSAAVGRSTAEPPSDAPAELSITSGDAGLIELATGQPVEPVGLAEVVDSALATVARLAQSVGVDLVCELGAVRNPIMAAKPALRHCLLNVLGYLLESAPHGARLRIEATEGVGVVRVLLSVNATSSEQSDAAEDRTGCSEIQLARRLASLQGMQLDVRRTEDGLQALLVIPTRRERTVLYVDDNPDMGRLFRQYLAGTGYGLVHVRTAERAIRLARATPPDVIVLDVLLPSEDGWQLLERLRAEPSLARRPVIMCSVLPEQSLAASLEVSAFLMKPITQTDLRSILERCCPLD